MTQIKDHTPHLRYKFNAAEHLHTGMHHNLMFLNTKLIAITFGTTPAFTKLSKFH